jgi:hypothetical protein
MMRGLLLAGSALLFLGACDGPQENAGESQDAAANPTGGVLQNGPQEQVGEIKDKAERDRAAALEAQADEAEHRADAIENGADQKADALEKRADGLRRGARQAAETLDSQADELRKKKQ